MITWREKRSGLIAPDERLPWGPTVAMGLQHALAMFGSTVVVPVVMGFDPNVVIFFSGVGTLLFFLIVSGRIPSYLGSSFSFVAPVAAVIGSPAAGTLNTANIPLALGGILAAGLVYALIGVVVEVSGSAWIDALMPPLVTGSVVMIIGLNLAPAARGLAQDSVLLAAVTLLSTLCFALLMRGMVARLAILLGAAVGYVVALVLGGSSAAGHSYAGVVVQGVDLSKVESAPWFGLPAFVHPAFDLHAISVIVPVAIILVAENTGHIKAVEAMSNRKLTRWLGRAFIGDGVATIVSSLGGGSGVTTYAENIGVMAVTRVYSTLIFVIAALVAISLGLCPKFGALVGSIPTGVIGGVVTVLFGLIAITGARIWVDNRVDFTRGVNLFIAGVVVIIGAADYTLQIGDFQLGGIGLGTFGAIILYQLFKDAAGGVDAGPTPESVTSDSANGEVVPSGAAGEPGPSVASR